MNPMCISLQYIFFHGICRQSWESSSIGPSRVCVVAPLIACLCALWGRRPEADCLLPPEKYDNSLTVHFLEYFSVIIKYKWRDLLQRKKMRSIFKLPLRLRASSVVSALALDGVGGGWVLIFAFSDTRTESSIEFLGSSVSLNMALGVERLTGNAGDLRVITWLFFNVVRVSPAHEHFISSYLCEISYSKQENVAAVKETQRSLEQSWGPLIYHFFFVLWL